MKYITHNRFKKLAACGEAVNIPYGTEMETAGDGGGTIVVTGTPEEVAACPASFTGQYLKRMLK